MDDRKPKSYLPLDLTELAFNAVEALIGKGYPLEAAINGVMSHSWFYRRLPVDFREQARARFGK